MKKPRLMQQPSLYREQTVDFKEPSAEAVDKKAQNNKIRRHDHPSLNGKKVR